MWCERELGIIYGGNLSETEHSECVCVYQHAPNELTIFNSFAFYFSLFSTFFFIETVAFSSFCCHCCCCYHRHRRMLVACYSIAIELIARSSDETMKKPKCSVCSSYIFFQSCVNQKHEYFMRNNTTAAIITSVEYGKQNECEACVQTRSCVASSTQCEQKLNEEKINEVETNSKAYIPNY